MLHIFSLVCFLIYGVKSSFGHPEAAGNPQGGSGGTLEGGGGHSPLRDCIRTL